MTTNDYLRKVLELQTLDPGGPEIADMNKRGRDVEATLNREFPESDKTIRYAGSYAKGTMIREAYDLDIVCYFGNEDTTAGETLADIFSNVRRALEKDYRVVPKTSALRIRSSDKDSLDLDFHIDVVPGRYIGH
jgi:tRNA nucleotidyltransferase (CCA-adding enzyme)